MAERVHQELLALPALQQLVSVHTQTQLRELAWKTKELVLLTLFQEHASSADAADALLASVRERKAARRAEKLESADREAVRKREDAFRADFMQLAATELARLGAPAMISWQKLVFDKDCCAQAFRLLLTRIKSSRRISASTRPKLGFKSKLRTTVRKSATTDRVGADSWNYDLSMSAGDQERGDNNAETTVLPVLAPSGLKLATESRRSNAKQQILSQTPTDTRGRAPALQRENATLAAENARLKEELAHLEAVNAGLQSDIGGAEPAATFDARRLCLVQAQNLQLQRQISLLQSAVAEVQQVEACLLAALGRWRAVVDAGVQEAASAGADQAGHSETGKGFKWMMAVPDALLSELKRVEAQIHGASGAVGVALEAKLRVGNASSAYLRTPATTLRAADVFSDGPHPATSHLRLDRLKALEDKVARLGQAADSLVKDAFLRRSPRVRLQSTDPQPDEQQRLTALADATRRVLVELGALGAVVSTASSAPPRAAPEDADSSQQLTALCVFKLFASAGSGKEREKTLKTQLRQLHAQHAAMENETRACRRETQYWRAAWQTQAGIVSALAKRVARLGDKKVQWLHSALADPLRQVAEAVGAFQRAQLEGSSRPNPFLPLLVDTLESQQRVLVESLSQWRAYSSSVETQVRALFDDYEANRSVLSNTNGKQ
ncbi:hypothetical protein PybrP1_004946 [[Pythium] brassicae (nom. inval.)]|nr:hypothetical protein PybrP1_004946 [[Pythium] brassicae (nom. inval.)]